MDQRPSESQEQARRRAAVVFKVRSGQITAREGAKLLGVSRKTYYEWESRALQAMTAAMEDQPAGRPKKPRDEEKQRLQEQIADLERKLFIAEKTTEVRDMLHAYERYCAGTDKSTGALQEKKRLKKKK
jgi:transposase